MCSELRARSYPTKFPICDKELKKSLGRTVMEHTFIPSTIEAKAGRSLPDYFPICEKELKER